MYISVCVYVCMYMYVLYIDPDLDSGSVLRISTPARTGLLLRPLDRIGSGSGSPRFRVSPGESDG